MVRKPSPVDSRAVNLELTSGGHKKVKAILAEMRRIQGEIEGRIGAKEADSASKTLRKILNSLRDEVS